MYSQPAYRVRSPPAISPTVAPKAPSAPQIPSALLRSAPSANMFITVDSAAGSMIAAPSPWTAPRRDQERFAGRQRAAQRRGREHAEPQHQDPAAAEQVGGKTAQQQEAAERQRVGRHN